MLEDVDGMKKKLMELKHLLPKPEPQPEEPTPAPAATPEPQAETSGKEKEVPQPAQEPPAQETATPMEEDTKKRKLALQSAGSKLR
jgi:hypothetical protein